VLVDTTKKMPRGLALLIGRPRIMATAGVINPEECPQCKRKWKRANLQDKSTECPDCRAYLDCDA
jgi:hypothetical protein